jgi:hypothetical protein
MLATKRNIILLVSIILLAVLGNIIWLSEILYRFSWVSLGWVRYPLYSPYLLAAFPAFAFLLPFILVKRIDAKRIYSGMFILYGINLLFYHLGDKLLRMTFGRFGIFFITIDSDFEAYSTAILILLPIVLFLLFGICYFLTVKYLIVKIKPITILMFSLSIGLVLFLSIWTYKNLPITTDTERYYNAVKAGYPVFWTIILMGLCGFFVEKRTREISA